MKLSQVLNQYYVMTLSEIVGFSLPEPPDLAINIHFIFEDEIFDQYFNDQEIISKDASFGVGDFVITDVDGEDCLFTALEGVDLNKQVAEKNCEP